MKIIIETTQNGVHLTTKEKNKADKEYELDAVYRTEEDEENVQALARQEFIYDLIEILGWLGGRYDAHRLRVIVEPGDKYEGKEKAHVRA